ncbi:MAG TPA: hypothetical protein VIM11_07085 [Tepidisphaeraceae bacterium]|jgi:hypothetical protein
MKVERTDEARAAFPDYRSEGLLCAVRTCSSDIHDLLDRHPRAGALRDLITRQHLRPLAGLTLADLLWDDLVEHERALLGKRADVFFDAAQGTAAQFWQRRRRLAAWDRWRVIERRLPAPWPRLLELPPPAAQKLVMSVGIDMVARSIAGMSLHDVIHWLRPFGGDVAGQVVEQARNARRAAPLSPAVATRWREACAGAARHVTGVHIPQALGRGLLAAMFRKLPPAERMAAAQLSRSSLAASLSEDSSFEPISQADATLAETMIREALSKLTAGGAAMMKGVETVEVDR